MKPYVPPPPPPRKPYWMMTAAEREAERLEGLAKQTEAASTASPTVKLEPQAGSDNAVVASGSGSGSGNSGDTDGNQQADTNGAAGTLLDEAEVVEAEAIGSATRAGANSTSDNALNGLEGAASDDANSKDGKDKDKVGAQPVEGEEEDSPNMVPMTLAEVDQADDAWDKEFLKVSLQHSLWLDTRTKVGCDLTDAGFGS